MKAYLIFLPSPISLATFIWHPTVSRVAVRIETDQDNVSQSTLPARRACPATALSLTHLLSFLPIPSLAAVRLSSFPSSSTPSIRASACLVTRMSSLATCRPNERPTGLSLSHLATSASVRLFLFFSVSSA